MENDKKTKRKKDPWGEGAQTILGGGFLQNIVATR